MNHLYDSCSTLKDKASKYALCIIMLMVVILSTTLSIQLGLDTGSFVNVACSVFEFSLLRTLFFIARSIFIFDFFPPQNYSSLLAIHLIIFGSAYQSTLYTRLTTRVDS